MLPEQGAGQILLCDPSFFCFKSFLFFRLTILISLFPAYRTFRLILQEGSSILVFKTGLYSYLEIRKVLIFRFGIDSKITPAAGHCCELALHANIAGN